MAIPYGIATEIEKSCFFPLFFWWRCVAIRRYRTVSPQKLKNLVFFNFFFGGDVWRYRTVSPQKLKKSCFFQLFFLVAMCGDTVRYRHRN